MQDLVEQKKAIHESSWEPAYQFFSRVIAERGLQRGAEIGVAFGGHSEAMLSQTRIEKLYGVDSYRHRAGYEDPMNLPQSDFDILYERTKERLGAFGDRFELIRAASHESVGRIEGQLDFIYIDADHSYQGVWDDLCAWFAKVRTGGIIGGHDYDHSYFPGVRRAIDEFFRRFDWRIHTEGEGVWWVEKQPLGISFFIPAFNCAATVGESVESIMEGNFSEGDELVIVDDCSTDATPAVLDELQARYPALKVFRHLRNKGGAAARNTAIENARHQILFCLDSDNVLAPGSIPKLKDFLITSGADVASFQELHYFNGSIENVTQTWTFKSGTTRLADYLSHHKVPGSSGNYMFTKESWTRAGGYPEFAGALDAWGFGFRQVATGSKMKVMPGSHYHHRHGHESYWCRDASEGKFPVAALQILLPFLHLLVDEDADYVMSREGRKQWYGNLEIRPLRLKKEVAEDFGGNIAPPKTFARMLKRLVARNLSPGGQRVVKKVKNRLRPVLHRSNS